MGYVLYLAHTQHTLSHNFHDKYIKSLVFPCHAQGTQGSEIIINNMTKTHSQLLCIRLRIQTQLFRDKANSAFVFPTPEEMVTNKKMHLQSPRYSISQTRFASQMFLPFPFCFPFMDNWKLHQIKNEKTCIQGRFLLTNGDNKTMVIKELKKNQKPL